MLQIVKEIKRVSDIEYSLEYRWKDEKNAGYSFPCNESGETFELNECAKESLKFCQENSDKFDDPFVETRHYTYIEPAVGKCKCGREITLDGGYMGAVQCECGQWYNLFGQELIAPEYWKENEDWILKK